MTPAAQAIRDRNIVHIRKAYFYNAHARNMASCNHSYMGGMGLFALAKAIGWGVRAPFPLAELRKLSDGQLSAGARYCEEHGFSWEKVKDVKLAEERGLPQTSPAVLSDLEAKDKEIAELVGLLREARGGLAAAGESSLGYASNGLKRWPIRNEMLTRIDAKLKELEHG